MSAIDVSIIVPVGPTDPRLDAFLEGFRALQYDAGHLELIAVGYGGVSLPVPESSCPELRVFEVDHSSPYAARNLAVSNARGDLFLFSEPTCVADPDWVSAHVRRLAELPVSVSVGQVSPARTTPCLEIFGAYEKTRDAWVFSCDSWRHYFGRPKNMAITRECFEAKGPFHIVARGADSKLVQLVARELSCEHVALAPDAIVRHRDIRGFPSGMVDRFTHGKALQQHGSSHAAPIDLVDRARLFRETLRRGGYGPLRAALLLSLAGAGILVFRLGSWVGKHHRIKASP